MFVEFPFNYEHMFCLNVLILLIIMLCSIYVFIFIVYLTFSLTFSPRLFCLFLNTLFHNLFLLFVISLFWICITSFLYIVQYIHFIFHPSELICFYLYLTFLSLDFWTFSDFYFLFFIFVNFFRNFFMFTNSMLLLFPNFYIVSNSFLLFYIVPSFRFFFPHIMILTFIKHNYTT